MTGAARDPRSQPGWLAYLRWSALFLLVSLAVAAIAIPLLRHFDVGGVGRTERPPQKELSSG